jgi:hypothetical protein
MNSAPKTIGPYRVICDSPEAEAQGCFLFGYDSGWNVVTDTWHRNLDEAKTQAEFEYEGIGKTWIIPKNSN